MSKRLKKMNSKIEKLKEFIQKRQGVVDNINSTVKAAKQKLKRLQEKEVKLEEALRVVKAVEIIMQNQLQEHNSNIVTQALQMIFGSNYQFVTQFVERRNSVECDFYLQDNDGDLIKPVDSTGGGIVDVAAFALRIASWKLHHPKLDNVIILDEPFRYVDNERQEQLIIVLQQLAKELRLQFIVVTHSEQLIEGADQVYRVKKKGRYSIVN